MAKTTETLNEFIINTLTEEQYANALKNGEIDPNQLYLTPVDDKSSGSLYIYKATFSVDGWTTSNNTYTQKVTVSSVDGGPTITSSMFLSAMYAERTSVVSTNQSLAEALAIINTGILTVTNGSITISGIAEKPTCDIAVYWFAKTIN